MKFITSYFVAFLALNINAQTESNTHLHCDSVLLVNGNVEILQVQEIKRNKMVYILCCDECAVPREIKLNLIDTIIYSPDSKMINLANEELITLKSKLDTNMQSYTSNQIASSAAPKKNKYARQNLLRYSQQDLNLYLTEAKKTRKTGAILTGAGIGTATLGTMLYFTYGAWLYGTSADNQFLASTGSLLFIGGFGATTIGLPTLTLGANRVKKIKNLKYYSLEQLNLRLKRSQKIKRTGLILSIAGPLTAGAGWLSRRSYYKNYDINNPGSSSKLKEIGGMTLEATGVTSTLIGIPMLTVSLLNEKNLKARIQNDFRTSALELTPCSFFNGMTNENMAGITLRLKL